MQYYTLEKERRSIIEDAKNCYKFKIEKETYLKCPHICFPIFLGIVKALKVWLKE